MKNTYSSSKSKPRLCKLIVPVLAPFTVLLSILAVHAFGAIYYPGDVNSDKEIDIADAVLLARFCAEDETALLSRQGMINADADNNKIIDSNDTIHILKFITQTLPPPPNPYLTTTSTTNTDTVTTSETETLIIYSDTETTSDITIDTTSCTSSESTTDSTSATDSETTLDISTETTLITTTETTPVAPTLIINDQSYPLDVSISVLTGQKTPNETLTVNYKIGNIIFAIFADDPADTTIAIAYENNIVGYYKLCHSYTVPDGYKVREYRDRFARPVDMLYAVTVLRKDVGIGFDTSASSEDLYVLSRLNYYALNSLRAANGVPTLQWHPTLADLSRDHSMDMAAKNYFDHTNKDGVKASDRFLNAGIDYMWCGENIARGMSNPFDALDGWYNSEGHRDNLLNINFTHVGIGFAYNTDPNANQCYYGTQDFCSFFP